MVVSRILLVNLIVSWNIPPAVTIPYISLTIVLDVPKISQEFLRDYKMKE